MARRATMSPSDGMSKPVKKYDASRLVLDVVIGEVA